MVPKINAMKKKFIIPLLILGMSIGACQKPDDGLENETQTPESGSQTPEGGETTPTYTIDIPSSENTSPVLGTEGGNVVLNFSTSAEWTANVINTRSDSWIDVSPKSGNAGEAKITISVEANGTYDERSATIQIKCGSAEKNIVVTQKQKDALTVTKSRFDLPAEGGEVTIEVNSNLSYDYTIDAEGAKWIKETKTKALSTTTLQFEIDENGEVEKREGTITISSGDLRETVNIYQEGTEPTLVLSQNEYSVEAEGETIQVEVNSNVNVNVTIQAGVDWVKETKTKVMSTNTYYFTIDANNSFKTREATITFESENFDLKETVKITQNCEEILTVNVPNKGGLQASLSGIDISAVKSLKITGVLNDVDFIFIQGMEALRNLDISEVEITTLPAWAFESTKIESFILPNMLTEIGEGMFYHSSYLKSIVIYHNVKRIDNRAFMGCTSLTSIEIPASVESIDYSAFNGCKKLATVTFEEGSQVKTIGGRIYTAYPNGAFANCTSLTSIEIPASVEIIESNAFKECTKLATVTFEKGSQLKTIGGGYFNETSYAGAFANCTSLTSIEIPASVELIKSSAFKGCTKLATVTFEKGSQLKTIGEKGSYIHRHGAFANCTSLTSIEIPASVELILRSTFDGCSSLTAITFENGSQLRNIGASAFRECKLLTTINIPSAVEIIDNSAFYDCTKLTSVNFEKDSQLKTIGDSAFSGLKLMIVDMSECAQVESIGSKAFYNNRDLRLFMIGTINRPDCKTEAFKGISSSYSVLKVPSGCVDAYKAATGWKNFSSITTLDE